jgi:hypothetical protein
LTIEIAEAAGLDLSTLAAAAGTDPLAMPQRTLPTNATGNPTPLTSLLQTLLECEVDFGSVNATLSSRLGLPAGSNLTSLNPIQGSSEILGQNAAVMTAAVKFS